MPNEGELIAQREAKRERLLALGGGYPARTGRTHHCADAVAAFEAAEAPSDAEQRLEGEGVTMETPVQQTDIVGARGFALFRDPDGVLLELIEL